MTPESTQSGTVQPSEWFEDGIQRTILPLPEGTTTYIRSEDDERDQFGVRDMVLRESPDENYDSSLLVSYTSSGNTMEDIKVCIDSANPTADELNEIGKLANRFLQNRAKYEMVPQILHPVDNLQFKLMLLTRARTQATVSPSEINDSVTQAVERLGILRDGLVSASPRVLEDMIQDLEALERLHVRYFRIETARIDIGAGIRHYRSKMIPTN